jgi:membrane dipeptidase
MSADNFFLPTYGGPITMHLSYMRKFVGAKRVLTDYHLPRWHEARVAGMVVDVHSVEEAALVLAEIAESQGKLAHVSSPAELRSANERGQTGMMLCACFDDIGLNPQLIRLYDKLDVVSFALSLNPRNMLVDGCAERTGSGLSETGIRVVRELNVLGILVDVSHTSDRGFWDVLEATDGGVLATHSNSRSLCDNPRNLSDDMIKALAAHGGIVGISTYPTLLSRDDRVGVDDAVRHVRHIVDLVGTDSVGVGADFIDYVLDFILPKIQATDFRGELYGKVHPTVVGLNGISDLPNLASALDRAGFPEADTRKIMGGNFIRVWEQARRKRKA